MNPVMEALCELAETDPLPAEHTSSHWQHYGRETAVERRGDELVLRASGFNTVAPPRLRGSLVHAAERWSYRHVTARLRSFPEIWRLMRRLLRDLGGGPNFYALRTACALSILVDHWRVAGLSPRVFALIGDGYGLLGALIRRCLAETRLYCVDLPKMLVFQAQTHRLADPAARLSLLSERGRAGDGAGAVRVTFVLPQVVEEVAEPIDCAINIASMQEMTGFSIQAYFDFLRRRSTARSRFYCVNRLRKEMPGGEIAGFNDYPWRPDDEVFLDGRCPYYTHFFAPYTLPNGPRLFGLRVPYVNAFDGAHMHRLVRLAPWR